MAPTLRGAEGTVVYARMIARDFDRNRVVTGLLVVMMTLSVVLAAASAGTLVRLVGASGRLMARADAPDVLQMHAGPFDPAEVERWAAARPEVAHHQSVLTLGIDGANLSFDGVLQTTSIQQNALVVPNAERDLLLDLDGQPVTDVAAGTIVLPVIYDIQTDLQIGDPVTITGTDGYVRDLTIAGFARDAMMNPAIASSKRLAVAASDLEDIRAHTGEVEHLVEFWLEDPPQQTATFEKAYLDSAMPQAGQMVDAATFRTLTVIGDGLVAAVIILVSLLLLMVAMLCLRFSFLTATEQDYREIGVLKAVGVSPRHIGRIYLTKYALLAGAAAVLGLLGGWAVTPLLTRNITRYMGSAPSVWNWLVPSLAAGLVFVTLVLFVVVLLRRFNAIDAVTALRAGATSRQRNTTRLRLHRSKLPVNLRLGAMDVMGRWPTYLLLFFVFGVSAFIMIVPVNSATTAGAPDFINYMGIGSVDVRIDLRHTDAASAEQFASIVTRLDTDPDVDATAAMVTTRNDTVDADGSAVGLYVENGDHTALPVTYAQGRAPTNASEIALSLLALNESGRDVGSTLPVSVAGQQRDLSIVGSYQDVTNGGKTAKSSLPTDADEVMWYMVGVDLAPGVDAGVAAGSYADEFAPAKVADIGQWRMQTLGTLTQQITSTAVVAAVVAVALAMLMTALFTRMLLARDAGQVAIQRALGADDSGLRRQYLTRMLLVLVLGVTVGTIVANTLGETLFNLMFEAMFGGLEAVGQGTSRIAFVVRPLITYVGLPAVLIAFVAAATAVSARVISAATVSALTTE